MYGAVPYLMEKFWFDEKEAKKVLIDWMENYNPDDYPEKITLEDLENLEDFN